MQGGTSIVLKPLSTLWVAHSAVADRFEHATLAEGAEVTAHVVRRLTAAPQWNTVNRRRRTLLLRPDLVLLWREMDGWMSVDGWMDG